MPIAVSSSAPVITDSVGAYTISAGTVNTDVVVAADGNYLISAGNSNTLVVPGNSSHAVIADNASEVVISAGSQGPQGIQGVPGIPGISGGSQIQLTAPAAIGGNRVVMGDGNYADNTNLATLGKVIGVTSSSAIVGGVLNIVPTGEVDGFFGFSVNQPVFLSASGTVTQTVPTTGYVQKIGVAISTTKLLVGITSPIAL